MSLRLTNSEYWVSNCGLTNVMSRVWSYFFVIGILSQEVQRGPDQQTGYYWQREVVVHAVNVYALC